MLKGTQRQMVRLKTPDSRFFEEAYFVLKVNAPPDPGGTPGMVAEANRILEENGYGREMRRRRSPREEYGDNRPSGLIALLFGVFCGGGAVGLLWFVLSFL